MVLLKRYFSPVMRQWLGAHWGKLAFSVLYAGYAVALFPLLLKLVSGRLSPADDPVDPAAEKAI